MLGRGKHGKPMVGHKVPPAKVGQRQLKSQGGFYADAGSSEDECQPSRHGVKRPPSNIGGDARVEACKRQRGVVLPLAQVHGDGGLSAVCLICGSPVHQTSVCPLVDGEFWRDASPQDVANCLRRVAGTAASRKVMPASCVALRNVKADGDCLFVAIGLQHLNLQRMRLQNPALGVGVTYRRMTLGIMARILKRQQGEGDVPLSIQIKVATGLAVKEYFHVMQVGRGDDARTWGGILEGKVLVDRLGLRIRFLEKVREGWLELAVVEGAEVRHDIAVAWNGAHYSIADICERV